MEGNCATPSSHENSRNLLSMAEQREQSRDKNMDGELVFPPNVRVNMQQSSTIYDYIPVRSIVMNLAGPLGNLSSISLQTVYRSLRIICRVSDEIATNLSK
jgi:hypothetical protein